MNNKGPLVLDPTQTKLPVGNWIERLHLIPMERRDFCVDGARAKREFGIDEDLAKDLVSRGLPHVKDADGEVRFAVTDLHYMGVRLGCATTYISVIRRWAARLRDAAVGDRLTVGVTPYVPSGTPVEVLVAVDRRVRATAGQRQVEIPVPAVSASPKPSFSSEVVDLLTEVSRLDYCLLPESLENDMEFTRRTGLSDCAAAALLLFDGCLRLGVPARTAYGLLLVTPFSTPHSWIEIQVDGEWVALSPWLLGLLARYGGLDGARWPPTRSPQAMLLRLAESTTPIVTADRRSVRASFQTKLSARAEAPR